MAVIGRGRPDLGPATGADLATATALPRAGGGLIKAAVVAVALLAVGLLANSATWSAWVAQPDTTNSSFSAGSILLADNSSGTALFDLSGMRPGTAAARCVRVRYTGSRPAKVQLFGARGSGRGLGDDLQLTVTRGSDPSGAFASCAGFVPDKSDYRGLGPGVLFDGLMSTYPATAVTAVADPHKTWASGESHFYRLSMVVVSETASHGTADNQTFSWQAR
jgi:hypothetical protein